MQSSIGLLNGAITSWSYNIQTFIASDSTDAETKAIFHIGKCAHTLRNFMTSAQFDQMVNTPPHIYYANNKATISLVKSNKLTFHSRHLDVPVAFTHDRYMLGFYTIEYSVQTQCS